MCRWAWLLCVLAACASDRRTEPAAVKVASEAELRERLGVPKDAKRVVIFAQNAHLDISGQLTFAKAYEVRVGGIFLEASQLLTENPRLRHSICEMAFLKHHIELHPAEQVPIRAAITRGALHIVGGGVTSPDTLLPETELLLRDYLHGLKFAESLGARPTAAWLPDSLGHAATAPDVLAAAGFGSVAMSHIDGAPTMTESRAGLDHLPEPGSTAATLSQEKSWDFWWHGSGGAKVLAHYMGACGLYCMGDDLDRDDPTPAQGDAAGFHGDDPAFTDARIDKYIHALQSMARTPYLLVPVGCDFQHPKKDLLKYLDGYNARQYPKTRVWAVAAGFDDYAALVQATGIELPNVAGELSPYFMGFYGDRGELKRRVRDAARPLFAAETFATLQSDRGHATMQTLAPLWETLARSNHHGFVTGTASDSVVHGEQLPLCDAVTASSAPILDSVLNGVASRVAPVPDSLCRVILFNAAGVAQPGVATAPPDCPAGIQPTSAHAVSGDEQFALTKGTPWSVRVSSVPAFGWRVIDIVPGAMAPPPTVTYQWIEDEGEVLWQHDTTHLILQNAFVRADVRFDPGGAFLASLLLGGKEVLAGPSFLVRTYDDDGGLSRLGHEMATCSMTPTATTDDSEQFFLTGLPGGGLRLRFGSPTLMHAITLQPEDRGPTFELKTSAERGTSRCVTFSLADTAAPLVTGQAAGLVQRPLVKVYPRTWWPAVDWLKVGQAAFVLRQSTGVHMGQGGQLELMVARNPADEPCDAEGAKGSDDGEHTVTWRVVPVATDADAAVAAQAFNRPILQRNGGAWVAKHDLSAVGSLARLEGPGVLTAWKPAERGAGIIVRALLLPGPCKLLLGKQFLGRTVTVVDAAERDIRTLGNATAAITLNRGQLGAIATLRIH